MHVCIYLPEEKKKVKISINILAIGNHFDLEFWPSQMHNIFKSKLENKIDHLLLMT